MLKGESLYKNYMTRLVTTELNVLNKPLVFKHEDNDASLDQTVHMNASPVLDRGSTQEEKDFHAGNEEILQAIKIRNRDYKALLKSEAALQKAIKKKMLLT